MTPVLSLAEADSFEPAYWVGSSFATGSEVTFLALEVVEAVGLPTTRADLGDSDLSTAPPENGDTLVRDAGKGRWVPASGPLPVVRSGMRIPTRPV